MVTKKGSSKVKKPKGAGHRERLRIRFMEAIYANAAQIILAHNHPSDNTEPSEDDLEITQRLVKSGKLLGIKVVDHIIITKNGFFSFKNKKLI